MDYYEKTLIRAQKIGETEIIGYTALNRGIPLVKIGGKPNMLIVASVHAREYITTELTLLMAENARGASFHYLPILDIDGVLLVTEGLNSVAAPERRRFLTEINGGSDFSKWKANANAVDINVNFDADWGKGCGNLFSPAPSSYVGPQAESEKETEAVVSLLEKYDYPLVVCYHSLGEVVYWGYGNNFRFEKEARLISDDLGYVLTKSYGSCGGLKDYYSSRYKGLGLTVEVGKDSFGHPCPIAKLPYIYEQHRRQMTLLNGIGEKIGRKIYDGGAS